MEKTKLFIDFFLIIHLMYVYEYEFGIVYNWLIEKCSTIHGNFPYMFMF